MDIRVNLISGDVCSFELDVERPIEFLNKLRPAEIFKRPLHQFLGKVRTVSINPEFIEWIEMDTIDLPTGSMPKSFTINQLSPEVFKSCINKQKNAITAAMEIEVSQNFLLAYGMATFRSGRSLHFEIRAKMERSEDRIKASQKIFNMPAVFIYGQNTGLSLINTRNIVVWQVVPGLRKSTFFSLSGELVSMQKAK